MKRLFFSCLFLPVLAFAAAPGEDWQKGKITDASTTEAESTKATPASNQQVPAVDTQVVVIRSGDHVYIAQEKHAWHSACLLIEGDDVKFMLDSHQIRLMDGTGTACRFELVREAKAE